MKRAALALALASAAALANPSTTSNGSLIKYPPSSLPVQYKVYDHATTNGISGVTDFGGIILPRTRAAFTAWTAPTVSCTSWVTSYVGTVVSGSGPSTTFISGSDNQNVVLWLGGSSWRYGSGTLGLTTTTYYPTNGQLLDSDMELNNTPIQFTSTTGPRWSSNADPNRFDFESVVLHEAGHFLGLNHTTNNQVAVMWPTVGLGELKRTLAQPDISDVCYVYPGTPGAQGSPCTTSCNAGLVCRAPQGQTTRTCTVDCTAGQACPSGLSCQNADSGKACFPTIGSPDLCKFCTSGSDCGNGQCVTDGQGHNYCTITCTGSSCGAGYSCQSTSLGAICIPTAKCTNQCTGTSQCAAGYVCSAGTCEPTGNPGDRCDISFFCKPCGVCVGTTASAYCRSCCGGQSGNGECNGCTPASCGAAVCTSLSGSTDQVCVPAGLAPLCGNAGSCSSNANCNAGQECRAGRCHNTCNPASPGSCTACYDLGGGAGVCACGDELVQEGEACGLSSSLKACAGGLKCAGSPSVCRKACTLGDSTSCAVGEACQQVGGVAVCVSGGPGQVCGSCLTGNQCGAGLTCVGGRCYAPCNINNAARCQSCVQQASNGDGVCACTDQRAQENQACPTNPPTACVAPLQCLNGYCRGECNIAANNCLTGLECQFYAPAGRPYCMDPGSGTGGGTGGTGGSGGSGGFGGTGGTGGTGGAAGGAGGGGTNLGCGCGAGAGAPLFGLLGLALAALARRLRRLRRR